MKTTRKPTTYGIYVRKSSDHEDRQVQSLVRQIGELQEIVDREGLAVHPRVFEESATAFKIGRPVFADLVELTIRGEINAWLCWHANRLTRNPVDAGMVVHLLDQGYLDHIRTRDRTYTNSRQDKLMIHIEFGFSKNDSEEKSHIIKSGLRRRMERGYPLGHPPVGYRLAGSGRGSGHSFWEADKAKLKKVRELFDRFLEGRDSSKTITQYSSALGLKSNSRGKVGGGYLSQSRVYETLTCPVYAGCFYSKDGQRHEVAEDLPRIITEDELDQVHAILGSRNVNRGIRRERVFPFHGFISSPRGERLSVDPKFHLVCDCKRKFSYMSKAHCPFCQRRIDSLSAPIYRSYRYYFSRRARLGREPSLHSIEEETIKSLLKEHIKTHILIPKSLATWAVQNLHQLRSEALRNRRLEAKKNDALKRQLTEKRRRLRELYMDGLISKAEFEEELIHLKTQEAFTQAPDFTLSADWKEEANKMLNVAQELLHLLDHGNDHEIRQAMSAMELSMVWDGQSILFKHSGAMNGILALLKRSANQSAPNSESASLTSEAE